METVNNKPITFLQSIKMFFKSLQGNDEEIVTEIDEIQNWEDSVNKIDTFSDSDKQTIKNIQSTEAELRELYKVKLDGYKKKIENQSNGKKKKGKSLIVEDSKKIEDEEKEI